MAFRFADRSVESITELLARLEEDEANLSTTLVPGSRQHVWFRGLSDINYKLVPSFHRQSLNIRDEVYMMNLFKQNAHEFVQGQVPTSEWEWMFLMRHHALPSRLLDWSENPLVGLFFAVEASSSSPRRNGVLWCLLPGQLNSWALGWPDNSTALPMFTELEAEYTLGENGALQIYRPSNLRRPRSRSTPLPPSAAICVRATRRIQAQLGVFTVHHADKTPLEDIQDQTHVWRFVIPAAGKEHIRDELRRIGITRRTIFPDLDSVAIDAGQAVGVP